MKIKLITILSCLLLLTSGVSFAQDNDLEEGGEAAKVEGTPGVSGSIKIGIQTMDEKDGESSKFNEYRDIEDGFYLYRFNLSSTDKATGGYLDLRGTNLGRDDQHLLLEIGHPGSWGIEVEKDDIPHLLSNKAKTPYDYQGNGAYTVPANAGITSLTAASLAQDTLVSNFLNTYLHSTDLGTKREKERVALNFTPTARLKFRLESSEERKNGSIITGAPLGDRPPRTVNVQLPEPVDYSTKDLKLEAEYNGKNFQAVASYLVSDFTNDVDSLTWQSMFFGEDSAAGTQDYNNDIGRTVSTTGRMALAPDNRYQNTSVTVGLNLPLDSRLTATASKGDMSQNENLLPYSYSTLTTNWNDTAKLPRTTSDAKIETTQYSVNYSISPIDRLNMNAFYRYYDLNNETKTDEWYYVTSDSASNTTAGTGVTNQRKNLAYGYTKKNTGLDLSYNIWKSTLGLGYEKEDIERDFREADTEEVMYKASLGIRPVNWLFLKAKYLVGDRDGGTYNSEVTDQSYHFTNAVESGNDRPVSAFGNHPDLRKSDVSDRKRDQLDLKASINPLSDMNIGLSYSQRKDDFDSNVKSTQPLAGVSVATAEAQASVTAGNQLGLLKSENMSYSADIGYQPAKWLSLSISGGMQQYDSEQRGMAFDENNRIGSTATPTPDWYNATKQWMVKTTDKTNTIGAGAGFVIIPKKLNLATDYSYSYGTVDIDYSGYGDGQALNSNTYYYAFADPEQVNHQQQTVNATLEYQAAKNVVVGVGYMFDKYKVSDWMQDPNGGWVEEVGSEYMLRDSSQDNRWGNRLVSMGSYLGPSYENHVGMLTLAYKW